MVTKNFPNIAFKKEKFIEVYAKLLPHFLSPNNISYEVPKIFDNLILENDSETIELIGKVIAELKNSNWSMTSVKKDINQKIMKTQIKDTIKMQYFKEFVK